MRSKVTLCICREHDDAELAPERICKQKASPEVGATGRGVDVERDRRHGRERRDPQSCRCRLV